MSEEALTMLEKLSSRLNFPESEAVIRIVMDEVENGADVEKAFPSVRELKVILPRRYSAVERASIGYCGFDELIRNVDVLEDDEKLLCLFAINSNYMFAAYFRQGDMSFVGCLYGWRVNH
jgi:hypothetical protein